MGSLSYFYRDQFVRCTIVGKAYERIRRGVEGVIGEEQCGFSKGRKCVTIFLW